MPDHHHDFAELVTRKFYARRTVQESAARAYAQWAGQPEFQEAAAAALVHAGAGQYFYRAFRLATLEADRRRRKDTKLGFSPTEIPDEHRLGMERRLYVR